MKIHPYLLLPSRFWIGWIFYSVNEPTGNKDLIKERRKMQLIITLSILATIICVAYLPQWCLWTLLVVGHFTSAAIAITEDSTGVSYFLKDAGSSVWVMKTALFVTLIYPPIIYFLKLPLG